MYPNHASLARGSRVVPENGTFQSKQLKSRIQSAACSSPAAWVAQHVLLWEWRRRHRVAYACQGSVVVQLQAGYSASHLPTSPTNPHRPTACIKLRPTDLPTYPWHSAPPGSRRSPTLITPSCATSATQPGKTLAAMSACSPALTAANRSTAAVSRSRTSQMVALGGAEGWAPAQGGGVGETAAAPSWQQQQQQRAPASAAHQHTSCMGAACQRG